VCLPADRAFSFMAFCIRDTSEQPFSPIRMPEPVRRMVLMPDSCSERHAIAESVRDGRQMPFVPQSRQTFLAPAVETRTS